jgi:hypothetical protein
MALRVALPRLMDEAAPPVEAVRARRLSLATYLQLDPAIRFVIALGLVTAISLLYLVQTSTVTELNYDVQRLQVTHTQLLRDRQRLQLDIAAAQALPGIRDTAVHKLHMVPVGDQYNYLGVPPPNVPVPPLDEGGIVAPSQGAAPPGGSTP